MNHGEPHSGRLPGRVCIAGLGAAVAALLWRTLSVASGPPPYDWLQFDGSPQHSGTNTLERLITAHNVGRLRLLFSVHLPATVDGAVAVLTQVRTISGTRDLLFATTKAGHLLALDAHSGATVWVRQVPAGTCRVIHTTDPCYTTSSPAVDPNRRYVYSYGLDGAVHKYRVSDGREMRGQGWPERTTLRPGVEKGSSALAIAVANGTRFLYATTAGFVPNSGAYQGHLTTINLATGHQHVFNTLCSQHRDVHYRGPAGPATCVSIDGGVWGRPGVVYSTATNRIYLAVGNGFFSPYRHSWGDSVLALHPDGTGRPDGDPLDSYTPTNQADLLAQDLDLGSTSPVLLPPVPKSALPHLALQVGKDGEMHLLNLDNLSGQGGPGHLGGELVPLSRVPQGGLVFGQPAVWVNPADGAVWVFVSSVNGLAGLRLTADATGTPHLQPVWQISAQATSPLVANGVLYVAGDHDLQALDPLSGRRLWHDPTLHNIHWESPVVANGILYISDWQGGQFSRLRAYSLPVVALATHPNYDSNG